MHNANKLVIPAVTCRQLIEKSQLKKNNWPEDLRKRLSETPEALAREAIADWIYDPASGLKESLWDIAWQYLREYDQSDVDSVVADAVLDVINHIDQGKHIENLKAWLSVVTRNCAISFARNPKNRPSGLIPEGYEASSEPDREIDREAIKLAMDCLKPEHREIVDLLYFKGLTIVEAADRLGIPTGTAKSRLNRALALLRETPPLRDDDLAELVMAAFRLIPVPNGYKDRAAFLEDLLSPAFLRVKENIRNYDPGRGTLEHFIYGIVNTFVRESVKKRLRQLTRECGISPESLGEHIRPGIEIETPKLDKLDRDLEWICEVVNLVASSRQRRISELRKDGHSFKEISERLGVTKDVTYQDMGRLRRKVVDWFVAELKTPRGRVEQWIDRISSSLDADPLGRNNSRL